jgi:glutamyl-tRNA reductase
VPADRPGSGGRSPEPAAVLGQLRERMNRIRERELATVLKRLPGLTPAQRAAVGLLSQALMDEFMGTPSVRLCGAALAERESSVLDAARYLFALDEGRATDSTSSGDARAA